MAKPLNEQKWIIYKHICKITGKLYIGQTSGFALSDDMMLKHRWSQQKCDKKCAALYNAIRKHGSDNFDHEVLENDIFSLNDANHAEEFWIAWYNTVAPYGYNIRPGGGQSPFSEETKKKISEKLKGNKNSVGAKRSQEVKDLLSRKAKSRGMSKEHKEKFIAGVRAAHKNEQNDGKNRICSKCKELKDRSCFHKNKNKWDGINTMCKMCYNEYNKEYKRKMRALKRRNHGPPTSRTTR